MRAADFDPKTVSRHKKARYLLSLSEDDFRDQVVRPLLLRRGFKDGRDLCGPSKRGKDALFVTTDPLGHENVYALQTKKGSINLGSRATTNLLTALTQLRTALTTSYEDVRTKAKRFPTKVVLCASGKINPHARRHILDEIQDPRIQFLDADDLISDIDDYFPEIWLGVDVDKLPYVTALRAFLARDTTSAVDQEKVLNVFECPATTESCVSLQVMRVSVSRKKIGGARKPESSYEDLPFDALARRRERLILVLGEAGGGKTTSLRRLAYRLTENVQEAKSTLHVPVFLRAADIAATPKGVTELLAHITSQVSGSSQAAFDMNDLRQGHVTVLVDGLDECASQEWRQSVFERLARFHEEYPRCQIIVASREYGWVHDLRGSQAYTWFRLLPIGWEETKQIIRRLEKRELIPQERVQEVLRRLQEVHGMELSPLLVTVFVASSDYYRSDIPANITELFRKYTEMMLGRWDAEKGFAQQFHAPLKDFLLCDLAAEMHRRRETTVSLRELEERLGKRLEERGMRDADKTTLLREIVNRSGLFRVLGDDAEFAHLLVQEFFAGRGLAAEEIPGVLGDAWWQRPLMFFFGAHPGEGSLLESSCSVLATKKREDLAQSAVTLGLSIQACYLLTVDKRTNLFVKVLEALTRATFEAFGEESGQAEAPLLPFLGSYLWARDGVSCDVIRARSKRIAEAFDAKADDQAKEYGEFWQIVGLVECGCLDDAYSRVKKFKPRDGRLLLALHLGSVLFAHQRVAGKEEKRTAEQISAYLTPRIRHLFKQIVKEMDAEVRRLRSPESSTDEGQSAGL